MLRNPANRYQTLSTPSNTGDEWMYRLADHYASPRTSRPSVYTCFGARLAFGTSFRDGTVFLALRMTEWPALPQRVVSEPQ